MRIIKIILRVLFIYICTHGVVVLSVAMYNEKLDMKGFDSVAACFGAIPFMFLMAMIPFLIGSLALQFVYWLTK